MRHGLASQLISRDTNFIHVVQVLRIWDAFFTRGVLMFYGVGLALLFRAEETLFHAKTASEAEEYLRASERSCIDADAVFSLVFKDDLTIPCKILHYDQTCE